MMIKWVCANCSSNNMKEDSGELRCDICGAKYEKRLRSQENKRLKKDVPEFPMPLYDSSDIEFESDSDITGSPKKSWKKRIIFIIILLVLYLLVLYVREQGEANKKVLSNYRYSNIVTDSFSQEVKDLEANNIKVEYIPKYTDNMSCGEILSQSETAGQDLKKISNIVFTYNAGINFSGWTYEDAVQKLAEAEWTYLYNPVYDAAEPSGTVLSQSSDYVNREVILTVSAGPLPTEDETAVYEEEYDFAGWDAVDAEEFIASIGWSYTVTPEYSYIVKPGAITSQLVDHENHAYILYVSEGVKPPEMVSDSCAIHTSLDEVHIAKDETVVLKVWAEGNEMPKLFCFSCTQYIGVNVEWQDWSENTACTIDITNTGADRGYLRFTLRDVETDSVYAYTDVYVVAE